LLFKLDTKSKIFILFTAFCIAFLLIGHLITSGLLAEPLSSLISGNDPLVLEILDITIILLFLLSIIGMLFFVFNFFRFWFKGFSLKRNTKNVLTGMPYKSILFFVVPGMLAWIFSDVLILQSRDQVNDFLDHLDDQANVSVNDADIRNQEEIVVELKRMAPLEPHHSHPEGRIAVMIVDGDSKLELELGRDSQDRNEYWIFYPKYLITESNDIGRIISDKFDRFDAIPRESD
jgi:hypothetical protein